MMLVSVAQAQELASVLQMCAAVLNAWELPFAKNHSPLVQEFLTRARLWISHTADKKADGMLYGGPALEAKWAILKTGTGLSVKQRCDMVMSMASFAQLMKKKDDMIEFRAQVTVAGKRSMMKTESQDKKKQKVEDTDLKLFD